MGVGEESRIAPLTGGSPEQECPPRQAVSLGVFAKHWTPGRAKTRLAAGFGDQTAADCARCFLEATLERLSVIEEASSRVLAITPSAHANAFRDLEPVQQGGWRVTDQGDGDLGARMRLFFEQTGPAVLLGADSPDFPLDAVREAIAWLAAPGDRPRLVLGPSSDGGYWLIGLRGAPPPIFEGMPWSKATLLEATEQRLHEAGWRAGADYLRVSDWYDVDDAHDLARLRGSIDWGDEPLAKLAGRLDDLLEPR